MGRPSVFRAIARSFAAGPAAPAAGNAAAAPPPPPERHHGGLSVVCYFGAERVGSRSYLYKPLQPV